MDTWNHLRAILLLPGMALVVIPVTILLLAGLDTFDLWQQVPATRFILPLLGTVFVCVSLLPLTSIPASERYSLW